MTRCLLAAAAALLVVALISVAKPSAQQFSPQLGSRFSILGMQRFGGDVIRVFRDSADGRCFVVLQESIGPIVPCDAGAK